MLEKRIIFFFCLFGAMLPLLAVDMPRSLAFTSSILGTLFYTLYFFFSDIKPVFSWKTLWLTLIIFGLSALSLVWALHFDVSLKQVFKLAAILPPQVLLVSLALSLSRDQLKPYIHFFPFGVALASAFLCFEVLSGGVFFHLMRGEDLSVATDPDEFNRVMVALSLYSFSALAMLRAHLKHRLYFLIILAPLVTALILSESQSAQLSFVVGMTFLFFFPYRSKIAWQGLKFIIPALMFVAPFFISFVYQNYAANIQELPMMARAYAGHRLEIWDYVSRYAMQEPLHGFGIEMTRATTDFDSGLIFNKENTTLHPHNFAIQIWIEFGLIGIMISMGLMYVLFSTVQNQFTLAQQKIILPTLMAVMIPASFAFGMWQGWWIALQFHLAAMCLIACKFTDGEQKTEQASADAPGS